MAVTPYNIIQGPGVLYVANWTGGTAPDLSTILGAAPTVTVPTSFQDVGGTTGGITVEIDETLSNITVDQLLDPVGARTTARTIQVTTTLMETQLENLLLALNGATAAQITPATSTNAFSQLDLVTTTSAVQPTYSSVIVDGYAPTLANGTAARRRFVIPKCLSQPKIAQKFSMGDQATVDVTFTAFYNGTQSPVSIIDQVDAPTP